MTRYRVERIEVGHHEAEHHADALASCHAIRREVFVAGQQVPIELELDGLDEGAEHFLAYEVSEPDALALGTARMRIVNGDAKAERVAVLDRMRGHGLGRVLMEAIEARARSLSAPRIRLNAQIAVVPFYEKLGYRPHGEVFEEAGIDHRAMSKELDGDRARI